MDISHTKRKKKPPAPPPAKKPLLRPTNEERRKLKPSPPATPITKHGPPREGTFNLRLTDAERRMLNSVTVAMSNERATPVTCAEAIRRLIFDAYHQFGTLHQQATARARARDMHKMLRVALPTRTKATTKTTVVAALAPMAHHKRPIATR